MEEYARVLIEKNGLPSLKDSITIGKQVIERKLAIYEKKIRKFEEAKGIDNKTFLTLFANGKLGDSKEWLKWEHIANVSDLLKKKLDDLSKLRRNTRNPKMNLQEAVSEE